MYAGRLVEEAPVEDFLAGPAHPYSRGLLAALPKSETLGGEGGLELVPIPGQVPKPSDFVAGCRFRDRCDLAVDACQEKPEDTWMTPLHRVACFRAKDS
jgi:oligopeptide/dipeptide ABC transporter ATP-binding protein